MSGLSVPHIVVIDPAVHTPELDTFNHMGGFAPLPLTYHLPALYGFHTLPAEESLIRGIIILGSAASVYDQRPWQRPLESWLKPLCDRGIPTLGVCYGHQMLAHMYGGRVGYVREDRSKLQGMRHVELACGRLNLQGMSRLIVTHNEMVTHISDEMVVCGTSSEIKFDALMHREKPIFSLQPHPEATVEFLRSRGMLEPQLIEALRDGHHVIEKFFKFISDSYTG